MFSKSLEKTPSPPPPPQGPPPLIWGGVVREGVFSNDFENIPPFSKYQEKCRSEFFKSSICPFLSTTNIYKGTQATTIPLLLHAWKNLAERHQIQRKCPTRLNQTKLVQKSKIRPLHRIVYTSRFWIPKTKFYNPHIYNFHISKSLNLDFPNFLGGGGG